MAEKKTFCLYPFIHLNFKVDGQTAPCFRSKPTGNFLEEESGWNSPEMLALRKSAVSEEKSKICESCWKLEGSGVSSYRENSLRRINPFRNWQSAVNDFDSESGKMETGPRQIEIRFSNNCNFQCRMCGPLYSSKWERTLENDPEIEHGLKAVGVSYNRKQLEDIRTKESKYQKTLITNIENWKESLEYIMIAGGEPLVQPEHFEMLQKLQGSAENIILEYSTNLSLLTFRSHNILDLWKGFKGLVLKVSVDGDPEVYPYVRKFGNVEHLCKNVEKTHIELGDKIIKFIGTVTSSVYNVSRIIEAIQFITSQGLLFHSSQVQYPEVLSSQILPKEEKQKITEKLNNFLSNLDHELAELFQSHSIWNSEELRIAQEKRIRRYATECIEFMNSRDESERFQDFLRYDKSINNNSDKIFSIYPDWKKYDKREY